MMQTVPKKNTTQRKSKKTSIDYNKLSIGEIKEKANFYIAELRRIQEVITEIPAINAEINKALSPRVGFNSEPTFTYNYSNFDIPPSVSIKTDIAMDGLESKTPPIIFSPVIPKPDVVIMQEPQVPDNSKELAEELRNLINQETIEDTSKDG